MLANIIQDLSLIPFNFFAKLSMGFVNGLGPDSGYMIIPK